MVNRLWLGGRIWTMDQKCPRASVLAARGPRLVYVGASPLEAAALLEGPFETIELEGRTVIPGLIDSHAHLVHEGLRLGMLDVQGLTKEEALEAVREKARTLPKGTWIHGRGWDQNLWLPARWPAKTELDRAAPDHPVVLDRVDKHTIWVNSRALAQADPKVFGPDPEGGEILRETNGQPRGILIGRAMFLVYQSMPPLDGCDHLETILLAQQELLSCGLTTVIDAGTSRADWETVRTGLEAGLIKLRFRAYAHLLAWPETGEIQKADGLYDDHLALDGIKLFSDGSLGSRSAWLSEPYSDQSGHTGHHNYDDRTLVKLMALAREKDLQAAIHVIGDAAVGQAVRVIEKVLGSKPTGRHWRLEHYQVVSGSDRAKVLAMGLIPSIQSTGLMTDIHMAEDRLGPQRLKRAYAWRDIIDRGGYIINGSDCPVEPVNPFWGMDAAVTRQDLQGRPPGGFMPSQALSRWEALASYTLWGARAAFQEDNIGVLKPGLLADLAIVDRDIMECPDRDLPGTQVLETVIGGETVYESQPGTANSGGSGSNKL
ncbi:MAG: amidohydrolase [Deltaproteobacteria bacterium]|jgi:predicted amidohydrolase YtcJ|nr:amidohydrolase [Deltaproteobacteria bacterium]